MTEEQYIRAHITRWDKIKTNLFILPAVIFALGIVYFMFFTISQEMSRGFFGVVLLIGLPSVPLNILGNQKIKRLQAEYRNHNFTYNN